VLSACTLAVGLQDAVLWFLGRKVDASLGSVFFSKALLNSEKATSFQLDLSRISSFIGLTPCGMRFFHLGI